MRSDIDDWTITFVDTGVSASIGERLKAVEPYLMAVLLVNYSDGLIDLTSTGTSRICSTGQVLAPFGAARTDSPCGVGG